MTQEDAVFTRTIRGLRPRWGTGAAAVVTAGAVCLVQAGPAAAAHNHTVVNCNDNPNALQPAIANARPGATLRVKGVCFGNFTIGKNLTLTGLKDAVLNGHDTGTTVTITGAFRVGLNNLTITHGNATTRGGGIFNNGGTVTLSRSTVRNNTAPGAFGGGGGIANDHGTMTLNDSTVRNNTAPGTFGFGGGFDNENSSTVTLNHSKVSNNSATEIGGGFENGPHTTLTLHYSAVSHNSSGEVGGIDTSVPTNLTLDQSTVSKNSSDTDSGGILVTPGTTAMLYRSQVLDNTAGTDGAGIFNRGTTTLKESTVSRNIAGRNGGGIYNDSPGNLTLRRSTVEDNTAFNDGGGIYNLGATTLHDSKVRHNHPNNCAPTPIPGCKG
ncbi:hypothetical protein [Streptomyces sp. NPDC001833]|uniref:hypothetical protein n=1 Tax=Streptomyces sp. NPDC001833 TaxID=3154658 RepID=UPI00332FAA0D